MKLTEEVIKQIIVEVVGQMQGSQAAPAVSASGTALEFVEKGKAVTGTNPKEVVVALPPGFGISPTKTIIDIPHAQVLVEVAAGIEEEGMQVRFVKNYQTADVGFLAHSAAGLSGSGVGIGILSRGTSVIHQKDLPPLQNLELFPQAPLIEPETFRAIGKNAAKYAKGENPSPVPVKNDPMARPRYQGLAALLHNKEVEFLNPDKKIVDVVQGKSLKLLHHTKENKMVSFTKEQIADLISKVGDNTSPQALENAVKNVLSRLETEGLTSSSQPQATKLDAASYPLGIKRKDLVKSATGLGLDDITLEKVVSGEIQFDDIKTRPETLALQAEIAESVNRPNLAQNLKRAGEMTRIPDDRLLEMYNFLRPYRATKQELLSMADELEQQYQALTCAAMVREAAQVYEKNSRLKGNR